MVENKEYVPTLTEWDELVLLWHRSRMMLSNTLAVGVSPRVAWVTKNFVETHPQALHRDVYAWLIRNLEIARGPSRVFDLKATAWHDEPTVVHKRAARGTPYECIPTETPAVAPGPRDH